MKYKELMDKHIEVWDKMYVFFSDLPKIQEVSELLFNSTKKNAVNGKILANCYGCAESFKVDRFNHRCRSCFLNLNQCRGYYTVIRHFKSRSFVSAEMIAILSLNIRDCGYAKGINPESEARELMR